MCFFGCGIFAADAPAAAPQPVQRNFPVMGTWAQLTLYGEKAGEAADKVREIFLEVEKVCNRFDPESELSKLNASAATAPFACSPILWKVLLESKRFHEISGGTFDVTIEPLMKLWGFYREQKKLPTHDDVKEALRNVGFDKIVFDEKSHTVAFKQQGVKIDLGGLAKGYAVDLACETVKPFGVTCGIVNLGGNLRCLPAPPPEKQRFTVGVRNPFTKDGLLGTVELLDASTATSGNYERSVTIEGRRYTHIMDVTTGRPVEKMISATVVCPTATDADGLSTTVFINGETFARRYHEAHPDTSFLLVVDNPEKPGSHTTIAIGGIWGAIQTN